MSGKKIKPEGLFLKLNIYIFVLFFSEANVEKVALKPGQKPESCLLLPKAPKRGGTKAKTNKKTNIHVMVEFGLQV